MRRRSASFLILAVLGITATGCTSTPNNTDACRELLNIQGAFAELASDAPTDAEAISTALPSYAAIVDDTAKLDAEGHVKTAATALGDAASDWRSALEAAAGSGDLDESVLSSLAATYVDADVHVTKACSEFLP